MVALVISTDAPAVPGPPQGHWTYADWESLTAHVNRYEISDGVRVGDLFAGAPDTTL